MLYDYVALNEKGRTQRGTMSAANEIDLEDRLKGIGLDLISCKVRSIKSVRGGVKALPLKDLIIICIHLEQLERAGVSLLDALADLRDSSDTPALKNMMADIYESVKSGSLLSEAMAKYPQTFNTVFTGLIATGEKTGNMADIFEHLAKHLKWVSDIQRKVKKATYYPMFLLVIMFGVISLMMLFVIPKLADFLKQQNFDLPIYTQALISFSEFFQDYWYLILATPVVLFFAMKILSSMSEDIAYKIDQIKLAIPFVGPTLRKIELARFCHFFALTFRSGIGMLDCLDTAGKVVKNRVIKDTVHTIRKGVSNGNSLTASLRMSDQFPNLVVRMFKVGEESGNLDQSLENVNFFYDREVNDSVSNLVGVIQPLLTIIMGGMMLWVSIAVFGPLYSSFSKMSF